MPQVVEGGSVLRVRCDYRCFIANTPYDYRCDKSKLGTAFILQLNGTPVIVTAHHVVSNAVSVTATSPTLGDGEARPLRIIGYNPHLDIAVLTGPAEIMRLRPFLPQQSSDMKPRQDVICVGFAAGTLRTHTTSGTVSGRNDFPHNRIQTDAVINPGNSGGPVIDPLTKNVIGVVTSGMNDMQTTNFFTPMDEAWQSIRRIITRYREHKTVGIDLGFRLNAVVRSVNAAACHGLRGGAYVAAVDPDVGLDEGDVIIAIDTSSIPNANGGMVDVNANMRVNVPSIWAYDAIDFRSVFDALSNIESTTSIKMCVRRSGVSETVVDVKLSPSTMAARTLFPDCEAVDYVTFGGIVMQTLSESHEFTANGDSGISFERPAMELKSKVAITHVASGCPFSAHGATDLVGCVIVRVEGVNETRNIQTLDDIDRAMREIDPRVIVLLNGYRVGATQYDIQRYDYRQSDDALRRGRHTVMSGPIATRSVVPAISVMPPLQPESSDDVRLPFDRSSS